MTDEAIHAIARGVEKQVRPVRNTSLLPSYRKKMSRLYTERVLRQVRDGTAPPAFFGRNGSS